MKKFVCRSGVVIVIIAVFFLFLNYLYVNTDYYMGLNGMDKYRHVPKHLDVVSFGASHSECCYEWRMAGFASGTVAFEMAAGGQTLVQNANLLDYFQDRIDEKTTVVIDVMPSALYSNEDKHSQTRYYQILPRKYIYGWNIVDACQYSWIPLLGNRADGLEAIWMKYILKENKDGDNYSLVKNEEMFTISTDANIAVNEIVLSDNPVKIIDGMTLDEMKAEGARRAKSKANDSKLGEKGANYYALERMLSICSEHNAQVIVTTTPTTPYYYDEFPQGYLEQEHSDIKEMCDKYNVPYIDYTGDIRFITDYSMWYDMDHMNGNGTAYFMQEFMKENSTFFKCL